MVIVSIYHVRDIVGSSSQDTWDNVNFNVFYLVTISVLFMSSNASVLRPVK